MTPTPRFVTAMVMACLPFLARGEGKCGDDPKRLKGRELVVTWTLPVPAKADIVTGVDDAFFAAVDNTIGAEAPGNLPPKVSSGMVTGAKQPVADGTNTSADPKKSRKTRLADLRTWEQKYDIALSPIVRKAIDEYFSDKATLSSGFEMYASLVAHPDVEQDGLGYGFCTCSLQRGVVMWEGGKETLYVRSAFHSEKNEKAFKNFRPLGVKVVFPSPKIWFPLRLNRVLPDPTTPAFVVLDILTPDSLPAIPDQAIRAIPWDLADVVRGTITLNGSTWKYVRLRRSYTRTDDPALINDVALAPPTRTP